MTDKQLYLAIGIPGALFALNFLGVLAGFFWQAKRFEDMSKRFEDVSKRLEDMSNVFRAELGRVEGTLNANLNALRSDLQRLEGVLTARIDSLAVRVKALEDEVHTPLVKQ